MTCADQDIRLFIGWEYKMMDAGFLIYFRHDVKSYSVLYAQILNAIPIKSDNTIVKNIISNQSGVLIMDYTPTRHAACLAL